METKAAQNELSRNIIEIHAPSFSQYTKENYLNFTICGLE